MLFVRRGLSAVLLLLASVVLWVVLAPNGLNPDVAATHPAILDRGLNGEPESLDPGNFTSNQAATVLRDIGEGLVVYLPTGAISGGVAESWTVSEDGTVYSFALRTDALWSDGTVIVANDFVRAFQDLVDPENAYANAGMLYPVVNAKKILSGSRNPDALGVRAINNNKLEVKLEKPTPHFLQVLTHPSTFPVEKHSAHSKASNGAYQLVNRVFGSHIELTKNPNYWNAESVRYEVVRYHIVDELAELNRFRTGELDITANVPSGVFEAASRDFPRQLKIAPYLGVYYYGFNLRNTKFQRDKTLREALSMAVDRLTLVEKVLARGELPAYSWVPPGVSSYVPAEFGWKDFSNSQRIEQASKLFSRSSLAGGNSTIRLIYNSSDVQHRIALAVKAMWEETLDLQVQLENVEFGVLLDEIRNDPEVEIFRLSWTADYDDADALLQVFRSDHPSNFSGYSSQSYDEALEKAANETDVSKRASLLKRAEKILLDEYPIIPLYFYVSKHLVADEVDGWSPNVLDIHQSQYLRPLSLGNAPDLRKTRAN